MTFELNTENCKYSTKKKRIIWITADYFIDVDMLLVPYIQQKYQKWQIDWYVLKNTNSSIPIPTGPNEVYYLRHKGKDPRIIREYARIFKDICLKDTDLIYSDYVGVPYYFFTLLHYNKKKTPIVHAAHNVIPFAVWPKMLIWYINQVFERNKHFQLFSRFTADYFKKHYPNKSIFCCPMTLKSYGNVTTNNYNIDSKKVNLLFFGNVIANKRLDLLIGAIKHLPEETKNKVHLTICGRCETPSLYIQQINSCKQITTYFKRIDDKEVPELFSKHDYLMLPYQDVAQSGPHMIAYYYNLPVIASDIDGFRERVINDKNGFLFKANDEQALIDTIIKATNQSIDEQTTMKTNLYSYAQEHFSLESVSRKYVEYFNLILK